MMPSCRSISVWLRRDRFTNMAFRFARSMASSTASRTASPCTWSNARATSPISSVESMPIGSIWMLSPALSSWLSRCTISGSRWPATSRASARSLRSGRIMDRATRMVMASTASSSSSTVTAVSRSDPSAPCSSVLACDEMASSSMVSKLRMSLSVVVMSLNHSVALATPPFGAAPAWPARVASSSIRCASSMADPCTTFPSCCTWVSVDEKLAGVPPEAGVKAGTLAPVACNAASLLAWLVCVVVTADSRPGWNWSWSRAAYSSARCCDASSSICAVVPSSVANCASCGFELPEAMSLSTASSGETICV